MTENEELLLETLDILEGSNFQYWISQGTLLGLVRENRILPWDNDIDISVWAHEVSKEEILQLFTPHGFKPEYVPGDVDCIHFVRGEGKSVDIGFYRVSGDIAHIRWVIPGGSMLKKVGQYLISVLDDGFHEKDIKGRGITLKRVLFKLVRSIVSLLSMSRSHLHSRLMEFFGEGCFEYMGYTYPVELLEDCSVAKFFERDIPVPREYEQVLAMTYGDDWRVPKENYIWYEQAENLS